MANNRRTASSASTANSSGGNNSVTSKLPKFLQKQPKSSYSPENSTSTPPRLPRKNTKISLFGKDSGDQTSHAPPQRTSTENSVDDLPVIVEPVAIPRSRTRSERPISAGPDSHPPVSFHASASYSGGSKIGDLPNRLSGWFSHAFISSATDLTLPSLLSQSHLAAATSPNRGKATNALLTAAKQGKGHLDKALRYLIDSDAMPDKSTAPIWLLGVQHPGYEPHAAAPSSISRRGSVDSRRAPSYRSSASSSSSHAELPPVNPANNWPPAFYADFVSRVWLTYRSQFMPIRDTTLSALEYGQEGASPQPHSATSLSSSSSVKRWPWTSGEKGWTSDAGWGCMLRTGQSLLANALIHLHLGRGAFFLFFKYHFPC
jgi:cysteine protease ATG4